MSLVMFVPIHFIIELIRSGEGLRDKILPVLTKNSEQMNKFSNTIQKQTSLEK